ncbi:MAG: sialidase family protein, partial [Chloroflexota bacterium]
MVLVSRILVLLAVLTALAALPASVTAETPSLQRKLTGQVLVPFQPEVLSGRLWLVTTGQDPGASLKAVSPRDEVRGGVGLQAPGAGAAALIPYRDPSAKFSRTVLLTRDLGLLPFQTEPHLAVNPKDPNHMVVGVIDYNFPGIVTYVSIDGGATWEGPFQPKFPRREMEAAGDPTITFDRSGNVYAAQISVDVVDFRLGSVVAEAAVNNVSVTASKDGGFSWLEPARASAGQVVPHTLPTASDERARGEVEVNSVDKPWMALGRHWEKPDQEVIYITYTTFSGRWELLWSDEVPVLSQREERVVIELVRSEDGGQTWSRPVEVSPRVRFRLGEEGARRVVQGSQPAVAPDGTLYVTWFDSTDDGPFEGLGAVWVVSSRDGGRTFSSPRQAATPVEVGSRPRSSSFRLWGTAFPQMTLGPGGEIYIAYAARPVDNPEDDGDIFVVRSRDGGRTWDRPHRANDDGSGRLQFFP